MPRIAIADTPLSFDCAGDDTLLCGALRAGIGVPHECLSGSCGKCYFDLVDGKVDVLWEEAPGLSPRARARGRMLACQTRPGDNCTLKLRPDPDAVLPIPPVRRRARFLGSRPLAQGMRAFTFSVDGQAAFMPGQFALLRLPGVNGTRAYSMSNQPNDDGRFEFIIKKMPGGAGTGVLFDRLAEGDGVGLDGPYGRAYLRRDGGRDVICIAGGSGVSPIVSIAAAAVRAPELAGRRVMVFYGGRGPRDICTTTVWDEDRELSEKAVCHAAISDEAAEGAGAWTGHRGFIHDVVGRTLTADDFANADFYVCGPAPMVEALQAMLADEHKVPRERIHYDSFF